VNADRNRPPTATATGWRSDRDLARCRRATSGSCRAHPRKCRQVGRGDAGSVYVLEEGPIASAPLHAVAERLHAHRPQGSRPRHEKSIVGKAVLLPNRSTSRSRSAVRPAQNPWGSTTTATRRETGYRARSMLTVPMLASDDRGHQVIQLISKSAAESSPSTTIEELALRWRRRRASRSNALLYDGIRTCSGFVDASVMAIESRDPTTSGRAARVRCRCPWPSESTRSGARPLASALLADRPQALGTPGAARLRQGRRARGWSRPETYDGDRLAIRMRFAYCARPWRPRTAEGKPRLARTWGATSCRAPGLDAELARKVTFPGRVGVRGQGPNRPHCWRRAASDGAGGDRTAAYLAPTASCGPTWARRWRRSGSNGEPHRGRARGDQGTWCTRLTSSPGDPWGRRCAACRASRAARGYLNGRVPAAPRAAEVPVRCGS
jgi:hypothetical protein